MLVERTASRDNNFDVIRLAAAATLDFQSGPLGDWFSAPLPIELTAIFTGGVLLYALRHRIRLDWRLGALAVVAILLTPHMPVDLRPLVWPLALPYVSTLVAYRSPPGLRRLTRPGDVSYGLYLWGLPVQQIMLALHGGTASPIWLFVVAGPPAYLAALGSWRLVERPALRLKPAAGSRMPRLRALAARR